MDWEFQLGLLFFFFWVLNKGNERGLPLQLISINCVQTAIRTVDYIEKERELKDKNHYSSRLYLYNGTDFGYD